MSQRQQMNWKLCLPNIATVNNMDRNFEMGKYAEGWLVVLKHRGGA